MTPMVTVNIIWKRKPIIPGDSWKLEHKGADKTNKITCMFDAKIFNENKYLSTI